MAVKIRLTRMGSKKKPFYRINVADSRAPRDGRFIETVGTYNPLVEENQVTLKEERVLEWLSKGAQPSDTVRNILSKEGVILNLFFSISSSHINHPNSPNLIKDFFTTSSNLWSFKSDPLSEELSLINFLKAFFSSSYSS